eukprot:gnl/Trimastix_PCT/2411.p1 GENE.gnl/Trimastix_PCT/2411~~gnl/Trimastix_PCT/2411.p1  ORF type:complete len:755 (+),score=209.85 gnl/Trimastix_PCT/2411:57-2267(+)
MHANLFYAEREPEHKLMATVSNGYMATVIGNHYVYLAGVFNGIGTEDPSHRAKIPLPIDIQVVNATTYASALDLECNAFYRRSHVPESDSGPAVHVEQQWFATAPEPSTKLGDDPDDLHVLVHLLVARNDGPQPATLGIRSNTQLGGRPDLHWKPHPSPAPRAMRLHVGNTTKAELPGRSMRASVAKAISVIPDEVVVPAHTQETFAFIFVLCSSIDGEAAPPFTDAPEDAAIANRATRIFGKWWDAHPNPAAVLPEQCRRWSQRSGLGSVEVIGDPDLARAVNSSLFHMLASTTPRSMQASLSPGTLATNAYNGHVFWDSAMWMYPALQFVSPRDAAQLLEYRFHRTHGAASKAASYHAGYKGFMFPWESAYTGEEVCPEWADTGRLEQHISMDIAWAVRQYWLMSHDVLWLRGAWPVIEGIAEWIASRVVRCTRDLAEQAPWASSAPDGVYYCIRGVIPPDEYAVDVDNSAFTNAAAQIALRFASEAARTLGHPRRRWENWAQIAEQMFIPFDARRNIHPEYEGYRGQLIKQADVILMGYPMQHPDIHPDIRRSDLLYYTPRTDPLGPAMTYAMEAVAFLELGMRANASQSFQRSYANIHAPFAIWTETPTGGAVNFITGAGGFIQAVIAGFGGVRFLPGGMDITPHAPFAPAQELRLRRVCFRGVAWDLRIKTNQASLHWPEHPDASCALPHPADTGSPSCALLELATQHRTPLSPGVHIPLALDAGYRIVCA